MSSANELILTLKRELKRAAITYAVVARHLQLSEASVKRLLSRGELTLSRLESICELLGISVTELARLAEGPTEPLTELTREQEEALLRDPRLLLMTYLALNQWPLTDITTTFRFNETEIVGLLAKLDRLGLIELMPGNRVKLKTARNFSWRKGGPIQRFFEEQVRDEFLDSHFDGRNEALHFVGGLLSDASRRQFERSLKKLAQEFDELARADSSLPVTERSSVAAVLGFRRWEFSLFATQRRPQ